jgi:hypothetical protein
MVRLEHFKTAVIESPFDNATLLAVIFHFAYAIDHDNGINPFYKERLHPGASVACHIPTGCLGAWRRTVSVCRNVSFPILAWNLDTQAVTCTLIQKYPSHEPWKGI